jgi:hypothetical protein
MKLLKFTQSLSEAQAITEALRMEGIYTFTSNDEAKRIDPIGFATGVLKVGIWVVIDDQYEDAVALLKDPTHKPAHPLTSEEMHLLDEKRKNMRFFPSFDTIATLCLSVLVICVIGYFLYRALA